ncbi:MAG: hypothetical protein V2A61_06165 [Calditrichota bacterium]
MKDVQRIVNSQGEVTALVLPLEEQDQKRVGDLEMLLQDNLKRHRARNASTLEKKEILELLAKHDDTISVGALSYELFFRAQVMEGLRDIEAGRTYSTEEVLSELGLG